MKIDCPSCHSHFVLKDEKPPIPIQFCPSCGHNLQNQTIPFGKKETVLENFSLETDAHSAADITLVQGHAPDQHVQFTIGPYQILRNIGKGGMGEVFLAYDTTAGRRIALKCIRRDLVKHRQMHHRFLKEARVTSQLTHPAIIPIYVIEEDLGLIYYTMPFVEGETLKTILREAEKAEKKGDKPHLIGGSIPPLIRIFLTICQAVAYAHSKHVLHRDLKPENVIIGKYGEVLILDWGLAKILKNETKEENYPKIKHSLHHLTNLGKVVGTIAYMAPERALGQAATVQTDIYSLGVILYQMLTLKSPFKRGSLKNFREIMHEEELYNPIEVAPHREVPQILSVIVLKCLSNHLSERYQTVDLLIHDIKNYLEGRSEWFLVCELEIHKKKDWEFQENVLMAEHIAITREREVTDWVSLMISKQSFPGNIKLEAEVEVETKCQGFGFLLSVPEKAERLHLTDGYCLWIGTEFSKSTKLLNSTIEVYQAPEVFLEAKKKYKISIEKIDNNIHFYLNDILQFSSISHNPLAGTHIGFISKDTKFTMSAISCYFGSESIQVSCLSVPDAFLAHKEFKIALSEYRRIGYSFPGTAEGREAMFRAGITLLEQGKEEKDKKKREAYFEVALKEFNKLHGTPGAPLEYLGKALVYQTNHDDDEEVKCFELALRRYPNHPLLHLLYEQIIYRMYESSRANRVAAYNFVLLAIRFIPSITSDLSSRKLFLRLKKNWEQLDFIQEDPDEKEELQVKIAGFETVLSFWLNKPYLIIEAIDHLQKLSKGWKTIYNALFCLIQLGAFELATKKIEELEIKGSTFELELLKLAILSEEEDLESLLKRCFKMFPNRLSTAETRILFFLLNKTLLKGKAKLIERVSEWLKSYSLREEDKIQTDYFLIASLLMRQKVEEAYEILKSYPLELLNQETTPLHFLYGCWLYMTEGKEIGMIHFSGVLDSAFPRVFTLGTHYLNGQLKDNGYWFLRAFTFEKRSLYQQLMIFYKANGDVVKVRHFKKLEKQLTATNQTV